MRLGVFLLATVGILMFQNCASKDHGPNKLSKASANLSQSPILNSTKLLWIGAHPDDEIPSSPLLKEFCGRPGKSCTLLSLTKGESGQCKLSGGCHPNLTVVRTNEFNQSGIYLGATVEQGSHSDGQGATADQVLSNWASALGSPSNLVSSLRDVIVRINPDVILTFDSRHGTTCHPDHKATGSLTIVAAQAAGIPLSSIYLVESVISGVAGSTSLGFRSAVPADNMTLTFSTAERWENLVHLMGTTYKSQYYSSEVAALSSVANENRTISFLRAQDAIENDPRYSSLCP